MQNELNDQMLARRQKLEEEYLRYHREYRAQRGQHGMGKNMHGRNGEDLVIPVPVGTLIKDAETQEIISDLQHSDYMRSIRLPWK